MTTASIPVDIFNPGQVFACLGLMELAETLCGETTAGFDWSEPTKVRFLLATVGDEDPISAALDFLTRAKVRSMSAASSVYDTSKWNVPTRKTRPGDPFPVPEPSSPATLPALLESGSVSFMLSSWAEGARHDIVTTHRDNVKFWAGAGGYPAVGLLRDALRLAHAQIGDARKDPFDLSAVQSSSFRFDWRRDYIPIEIGFSLNEHGHIQCRGFPLVEVLAAIGLTHARPLRVEKLRYRYAVIGRGAARDPETHRLLPPTFLRAALGLGELPFATRTFTMQLDWPGQENQARCITTVSEDPQ